MSKESEDPDLTQDEEEEVGEVTEINYDHSYEKNNVIYKVIGNAQLHYEIQNNDDFTWTRSNTWLLIRSYESRRDLFRNPKIKNKMAWQPIIEEFKSKGHNITADALDRKLRNLKKTYKTIKDRTIKSQIGREHVSWEYYDALDEIFCDDKSIITLCQTPSSSIFAETLKTSTPEPPLTEESTYLLVPRSEEHFISNQPPVKRRRGKQFYELTKKQIDIEKQRVDEIRKLRESIERGNKIQEERNAILRSLFLIAK